MAHPELVLSSGSKLIRWLHRPFGVENINSGLMFHSKKAQTAFIRSEVVMINQELLKIIVCPETKRALHLASAEELAKLNDAVNSRKLRNRAGCIIDIEFEQALVRDDSLVAYAIRDDIPVMLIEEAIEMPD